MDAIEQIEGMKIKELFTELKKVKLEKDDVLIFSIKEAMTDEHYEGMRAELDVIFPNNKKIILEGDIKLQAVLTK